MSVPSSDPQFIGREPELATLLEWYAKGASPILISGPPGVGKSALATAFLREVPKPIGVAAYSLGDDEDFASLLDDLYKEPPHLLLLDDIDRISDETLVGFLDKVRLSLPTMRIMLVGQRGRL